jgi:hypothetical protein
MSKWSKEWNKLPDHIRHIGAMVQTEMRINQLHMERDRLCKRHKQSLAEIDQHIKNLEASIADE